MFCLCRVSVGRAEPCEAPSGQGASPCCPTGSMWDQRFSSCVPDARSRCIAGDADACVTAGDYYRDRGGDANRAQAEAYYRKACDRAAAAGCTAVGDMQLRREDRTAESRRAAEAWYARGCEGAHLRACTALAESYLARGATAQRERALSLLHRACDGLDQRACARLALLPSELAQGDACELAVRARVAKDSLGELAWARLAEASRCGPSDRNQVYQAFAAACAAGEAEGCFEIAQRQLTGSAPEPQLTRVRDWLADACKNDLVRACVALADDFERGASGPQDPSLMRAALEAACDLGDANACARRAIALGTRAPIEIDAARDAWSAACKADASHCVHFAEHLLDHPESERDRVQAERLLQAACDRQLAAGCALLADVRGWRAVQGPSAFATQEFAAVEALLETACGYEDADSCVKAGLMLLNDGRTTHERARTLLEAGCSKRSQLACAYLKQGPYPFPYPSRSDVPLRFAVQQGPKKLPEPTTTTAPAPVAELEPARAEPERDSRSWLQAEFLLAATSDAKVGALLWSPQASFGGGWGALAVVPVHVGTVRGAADQQASAGLGNAYFSLTYRDAREHDRFDFGVGSTLPFAYVPSGDDGLGLQAAADSSGLRDAYLWTPNSAGLAAGISYESGHGALFYGADIGAALLVPFYSRDNAEAFGSLRGTIGWRMSRRWAAALGLAARGLSDAEQARLALEPELVYVADGGGSLTLGLCVVLWSTGHDAMGGDPWAGLKLRFVP